MNAGRREDTEGLPRPEFLATAVTESSYCFFASAPGSVDLGVVCAGRERCAPDYAIRRDSFPYYCLEVVSGGRGRVGLGEGSFPLEPGVVFAYGPGIFHTLESDPNHPLEKVFIDFQGCRAESLLREAGLWQPSPRRLTRSVDLEGSFHQLQEASRIKGDAGIRMAALVVELLLLRIGEAGRDGTIPFSSAELRYEECRQLIESDYLTLHTLADIASACHLDRTYLCRLFARFGTVSPVQLLVLRKMEHAAGRMRHAGVKVSVAGEEVGYGDPYHFSRVFKRLLGVSPKHYLV